MRISKDNELNCKVAVEGASQYEEKISGDISWYETSNEADREKFDIVIDASKPDEMGVYIDYRQGQNYSFRVAEKDKKDCIEQLVKIVIEPQLINLDLCDIATTLQTGSQFKTEVFSKSEISPKLEKFLDQCEIKSKQNVIIYIDGSVSMRQLNEISEGICEIGENETNIYVGNNSVEMADPDKIRVSLWY